MVRVRRRSGGDGPAQVAGHDHVSVGTAHPFLGPFAEGVDPARTHGAIAAAQAERAVSALRLLGGQPVPHRLDPSARAWSIMRWASSLMVNRPGRCPLVVVVVVVALIVLLLVKRRESASSAVARPKACQASSGSCAVRAEVVPAAARTAPVSRSWACATSVVELAEDKGVDLARLHTRRLDATLETCHTAVALDGDRGLGAGTPRQRVEGDDVEGADNSAHGTPDAAARIHQHNPMSLIATDGARRAHLLTGCRVAMTAPVGKGGGRRTRLRRGLACAGRVTRGTP